MRNHLLDLLRRLLILRMEVPASERGEPAGIISAEWGDHVADIPAEILKAEASIKPPLLSFRTPINTDDYPF